MFVRLFVSVLFLESRRRKRLPVLVRWQVRVTAAARLADTNV
jgi:hypothetical protein